MRLVTVRRAAIAALTALLVSLAHATTAGEALGSPGLAAMHGPAQKSFLGTALSPSSQIYFTGYRGIVSEVYYPVLDTTETVDLQFLVGDAAGTFVDEEKLVPYSAAQTDPRTMSWQVTTGNAAHNWQIGKTIYTDPTRNSLIERVNVQVLNGKKLGDYRLYLLFKPHLDNVGLRQHGLHRGQPQWPDDAHSQPQLALCGARIFAAVGGADGHDDGLERLCRAQRWLDRSAWRGIP